MDHSNTDEVRHRVIISNMIEAKRKYYAEHPDQSIVKAGPFQELVVDCIGRAVGAIRKAGIERTARKKARKP